MKTEFLGLRTTIYKVDDMEKAKTWYAQVLDIKPYFDESFYIGFNVAGFELGLQPAEEANHTKSESVLTYWGVDDIESTYQRLVAAGAAPHQEPTDVGGEIKVAAVKDPWGNIFGIIYNPFFAS